MLKYIKYLGDIESQVPYGIQRLEYFFDESTSSGILREYKRHPYSTDLEALQMITLDVEGEIKDVISYCELASESLVDYIEDHQQNIFGDKISSHNNYHIHNQTEIFITESYFFYPNFKLLRRQVLSESILNHEIVASTSDQKVGPWNDFQLPYEVYLEISRKV
ncbi:hypothetical protein CL656_03945 [bacterium]|nr:hypothetical protein [bacterium]|tara:strand:- start:5295 stop:5786 length:492 start_codon:yes stop_codon:yes gene_type:complete